MPNEEQTPQQVLMEHVQRTRQRLRQQLEPITWEDWNIPYYEIPFRVNGQRRTVMITPEELKTEFMKMKKYFTKNSKNKDLSLGYGDIKKKGKDMPKYRMFKCLHCGKKKKESNLIYIGNGQFACKDCYEELYTKCKECGRIIYKESARTVYSEDNEEIHVCGTCFRSCGYHLCDDCGNHHAYREMISVVVNGSAKRFCKTCLNKLKEDNELVYCDHCGRYTIADEREYIDGKDVCKMCYKNDVFECDDCGERHLKSNMYYDEDDDCHYCRDCYVSGSILGYHSDLVNFDTLKSSLTDQIFGFELEVAGNRHLAREFSKYFNGEMVMMNDSSVDGFEIITMPMDLKFMYETFFPKLEKGLNFLKRNGFRGHNHGGLHIHVSENQIDAKTAGQLKHILYGSPDDINTWLAITQRKPSELKDWARMSSDETYSFGTIYNGDSKYIDRERHTALNYDSRTQTYEFRIFNSSLRMDRILKNVECVLALIDYAKKFRTYKTPSCSTPGFIEYVYDNKDRYKTLYAFFLERDIKAHYGTEYTEEELEVA